MDIEGLDNKITDVVPKAGLVTNPADLYELDIATVAGPDRMGEVSGGRGDLAASASPAGV
jgi:DNA ligase (NAD+)